MGNETDQPKQPDFASAGWDGDTLRYFDPVAGKIRTRDTSGWDFAKKQKFKDLNNLGYYEYEPGVQVYGIRPSVTYQDPQGEGEVRAGIDPWRPQVDTGELALGLGDEKANSTNTPSPAPGQPIYGDPLTDPFSPGYQGPPAWQVAEDVNTSWNFTNPDRTAPDRGYEFYEGGYSPGTGSPWGTPAGGTGGNEEFYQKQFGNLLRQDQAYQGAAQAAREAAAQPQPEADPFSWDQVSGYLGPEAWYMRPDKDGNTPYVPGSQPGGGEWGFNPDYSFQRGMTNQEILSQLGNIWTPTENEFWQQHASNSPNFNDSMFIASFTNPTDYMNALRANNPGAGGQYIDNFQKLANNVWTQGGN